MKLHFKHSQHAPLDCFNALGESLQIDEARIAVERLHLNRSRRWRTNFPSGQPARMIALETLR